MVLLGLTFPGQRQQVLLLLRRQKTSKTFIELSSQTPALALRVIRSNCWRVANPLISLILTHDPTPGEGYDVATGTQDDSINLDGIVSTCLNPKNYPGNPGITTSYKYNRYRFYQGYRSSCISITVDANVGNNPIATVVAYSPTYDPLFLNVNYLGDPGVSATSMSFSVNVPANTTLDVVVLENSGLAPSFDYTLNVSGLSCSVDSPSAPCPSGL
jgi:hypothetical protein